MRNNTYKALQSIIPQLFETAVSNIQDVTYETDDIDSFDSDEIIVEASIINNLQRIKEELDYAEETDEIEYLEPNLKFLNRYCSVVDIADLLGEEYASELNNIWYLITGKELTDKKRQSAYSNSNLRQQI